MSARPSGTFAGSLIHRLSVCNQRQHFMQETDSSARRFAPDTDLPLNPAGVRRGLMPDDGRLIGNQFPFSVTGQDQVGASALSANGCIDFVLTYEIVRNPIVHRGDRLAIGLNSPLRTGIFQ